MTAIDSASVVYIAEFVDGPLEGQTEKRALIHGASEPRITMVVAVDGLESLFWYNQAEQRDVQGQLHVTYTFDRGDSDPVVPDHEPGDAAA